MNWINRIRDVDPVGRTPRFLVGSYTAQIDGMREHNSKQGGKQFFIAEFTIVESTHPQLPPGSKAGTVIRMNGDFPDTAIGEVKGMIAAACGIDPADPRVKTEITPEVVQACLMPQQPMAGRRIRVDAQETTTKGGKPFVRLSYSPVQGQPAQVPTGVPAGAAVQAYQAPQPYQPQQMPMGYGTAPTLPQAPPVAGWPAAPPPVPTAAPAFPPAGWTKHPLNPEYYYRGNEAHTEAVLRQMMAQGKA